MISVRPPYTYRATLVRVIDGDTYVLDLDLGFDIHAHVPVRLLGWDAPEHNTPDGVRATKLAETRLKDATRIMVATEKDEQTFARWLAHVSVDGVDLGDILSMYGLAVPMKR